MADKHDVKLSSKVLKSIRPGVERRTERRLLCSNLVKISWAGTRGHRCTEIGVLENVSKRGFGLYVYLTMSLKRGTELSVVANRVEFNACVMQCSCRENGYLVGLALDEPCEWVEGFGPEHLLDVTLLDLE
jgi:hypothetical protein